MSRGVRVILVSSGAVSAGYTVLLCDRKSIGNKQALAAIRSTSSLKDVSREVCQIWYIAVHRVPTKLDRILGLQEGEKT